MKSEINSQYPSVDDLREKAQRRIPRFAFEYLDGGCNEDVNLSRNTSDIRKIQLRPRYLRNYGTSSTKTKVLGMEFDAPFGVAPVGLQGTNVAELPGNTGQSGAQTQHTLHS